MFENANSGKRSRRDSGHGPEHEAGDLDENGDERASHKVGYGSKLFVKDGAKIARGDKLFEWDPYTLPIIAEKAGTRNLLTCVRYRRARRDR